MDKKEKKIMFKTKVKFPKNRFTKKEIKIGKAMAEAYASSPYLSDKQKEKLIQDLFKKPIGKRECIVCKKKNVPKRQPGTPICKKCLKTKAWIK